MPLKKGRKSRKRPAASVDKLTTVTLDSDGSLQENSDRSRIMGFVSEQELSKYAHSMGLKRLMLTDLDQQSDMESSYCGGCIINSFSSSYSQGHDLNVFIQDESTTQASQSKHLMVTISKELAEGISLRSNAKLFVYNALVMDDPQTVSQDHGKCLLVGESEEGGIWIVHKDVHDSKFFSRMSSCGKKWWNKTKQRRERIKSKWSADNGSGSCNVPSVVEGTTVEGTSADGTGVRSISHENSIPGGSQSSSFPDNPDFPDSAFMKDDSSNSSSSSSSDDESDREWTKKQRRCERLSQYSYKKLGELRDGDIKKNIICVVKDFKPPAPTRGSDYYSLLTLIDESDSRVGIRTIIFNKDINKLPHVKREGDIVCIHRIGIKIFNHQIQIEGGIYCSIIRFSGEIRKKIRPCTGSVTFSLSTMERERIRELRVWAWKQRMESQLHTLQSVYPETYFDLICQVVSVTISKVPCCLVLTVWDGTPHKLKCRKINLEKNYDEGYPEVRDNVQLSESSAGYTVNIVVYRKKCLKRLLNLFPGKYLYLKDLYCTMVDRDANIIEICIHKKNDVCFEGMTLSNGGTSLIMILNRGDELCRSVEERIERTNTPITTTPHCTQVLCTIADINAYNEAFPTKFRCLARVLAVNASSLEDLVVLHCSRCEHLQAVSSSTRMKNGICCEPCPKCSDQDTVDIPSCFFSWQYYFKMTLWDASGELSVEVGHQQAMKLFGGIRPNNFYQYQQLRFELSDLLYRITGGNNPFAAGNSGGADPGAADASDERRHAARPWLDCCILAVKHNETIHYCLFDTLLKQPDTTASITE